MNHEFPKESIFGDAHTLTIGGFEYDVYKLIEITKNLEPVQIRVADIEGQILEEQCWTDSNERKFSPHDLLNAYNETGSWEGVEKMHPEWLVHIDKIKNADYSYPILMLKNEVIDGMHRLFKAVVDKVDSISAKFLEELPQEAIYISK